ncbi:MAG: FAD-dependent oxidoreductase [Planctomycetales bacterium]
MRSRLFSPGRLFHCGIVLAIASQALAAEDADVLVYGSTPGGFSAAIAAAREGASVILLEPSGHVGGLLTGGLCFSDSNQTVRSTVMGLFDEWHRRISADYERRGVQLPYDVAVKNTAPWSYEPHVAARVTRTMLDEAKVRVLTGRVLRSATKDGPRITSLVTSDGEFAAKVFIDATYEGDLMAAAGVEWTIGREGRDEYGESLAGKQYPKPRMAISGFDDDGKPLPLVTATEEGSADAGDRNVMVYSFRLCLTGEPKNRIPFPAPKKYDPARFEIVRRYLAQESRPVLLWDLYQLPGDKWDANNGIGKQFSLGLVGACNGWSEADARSRAAICEKHRQYTLEMYRFLTTDPAVPESQRNRLAGLGLCKDEFPETGHWSPQLYVREGRRMRGVYVLSQKDIIDQPEKDDAIVVSSFPIDSHDCRRIALPDGGVVNEGTIYPVRMPGVRTGYPYHVPYRAILPKPAECDNLLVPVALSSTHVALSSIRVEPTWMILGQSSGIAAAMAAKEGCPVQRVPYDRLRKRLLAGGQILELPPRPDLPSTLPGIVLDDATATLEGNWEKSTMFVPHVGTSYVHDAKTGDGKAIATFAFEAPEAGRYRVGMAYSAHPSRATRVPVVVRSGDRTTTLIVDQTVPVPREEFFRPIGTVELLAGVETTITIANQDTDGFVILDALRLLPEEK